MTDHPSRRPPARSENTLPGRARSARETDDAQAEALAEQRDIAAALRGDADAFNRLIARHQDRVYTVACRYLGDAEAAADAAQDALITAYTRLNTYRGGHFGAWLARIAANTALDALRYQRRRPAVSIDGPRMAEAGDDGGFDDGLPIAANDAAPEQAALDAELARAVQACIAALPPDQRLVLVMCDVDEQDYAAIGEAAGVPIGTVKSRLSRARAAMRACLAGLGELLPAHYRPIGKT